MSSSLQCIQYEYKYSAHVHAYRYSNSYAQGSSSNPFYWFFLVLTKNGIDKKPAV